MPKTFDYYRRGEYVPVADLKVIAHDTRTNSRSTTKYTVTRKCCGAESTLSHAKIERYIRENRPHCRRCAMKAARETVIRQHAEARGMTEEQIQIRLASNSWQEAEVLINRLEKQAKASARPRPSTLRIPLPLWPAPRIDL